MYTLNDNFQADTLDELIANVSRYCIETNEPIYINEIHFEKDMGSFFVERILNSDEVREAQDQIDTALGEFRKENK